MPVPLNPHSSWSRNLLGFGGWLLLCFVAAGIGGYASANAGDFYLRLERPPFAPPAWLFGPVWTTLYILMAVAAFLVWRKIGWKENRRPLGFFLAQLACNALWPWMFFAWHQGALSCVAISILWILLLITTGCFWGAERWSSVLLWPYLAWVSYALVLNFALYRLNRTIL